MTGSGDLGNGSGLVLTRADQERLEDEQLAPYACRSGRSRGRAVDEPEDRIRTAFQRDRDRVIHCTAFRRLLGKTQVLLPETGDHFRVRLTHSLEVAQVARSISRGLRLNQDLTEVLALAHDLGHAPFGHSGGDALHEVMKPFGGFEHNRQALRIVERIERRYPAFPGLNLTYEVRESILKHRRPFVGPAYEPYRPRDGPCLEAQVVDEADGIAYNSHDLDDGLRAGILDPAELEDLVLWRTVVARARERYPGAEGRMLQIKAVAQVIDFLVADLMQHTARVLEDRGIDSLEGVRAADEPLVTLGPEVRAMEKELRRFLFERFYSHYRVARMRHRAKIVVTGLFGAFRRGPELMPPRFREFVPEEGLERAVSDYVAGMTDRYAQRQYGLLFQATDGGLEP